MKKNKVITDRELEFCEQNIDRLLTYLGRRWQKSNQEIFFYYELVFSRILGFSRSSTQLFSALQGKQ
jgi:hypothetical protein